MRRALLVAALVAGTAAPLAAQGSIFAIHGLGWSGRPVTARTAGTGGALSMFDPAMSLNPAVHTRWRSVAAWAVGAPTTRSFSSPTVSADQETVRFPLFGFAAILPSRTVIGLSISDYLDRTWTLTEEDTVVLRGVPEPFTNAGRSIGGVSDMALNVGYRLTPAVSVGLAYHYYLGSARLTAQRLYDNTAYQEIIEQSQTDFSGMGVGAGVLWTLPRFDLSASARLNGRLRSANTSGSVSRTSLPTQLAIGARWVAVPGVFLAGSAQYDGWARAERELGAGTAQNVWSFGLGAEVSSVSAFGIRTPLRAGWRSRTLPFTSLGESISEYGISAGVGFNFARDRTTVDFAFEGGSRTAGAAKETFRSVFVGITVRP